MYQTNPVSRSRKTSAGEHNMKSGSVDTEPLLVEHRQRASWLDDQTLVVRAAAKLNLTLSVGPKRPDGFHEFESLMTTITLYDDLLFRLNGEGINLTCDDASIPTGIDNLVYRAAVKLAEEAEIDPNITVELVKRIPSQAGLGGGSAAAAGTLLGLNELWNLRRSTDSLVALSASLGSDVGFFLKGPLAICTGRGEIVTPVDQTWNFWAVIIKPPMSLSTAEVYRRFEPVNGRKFERAASLAKKLAKSKPSDIYPFLENDLEASAFAINEELSALRKSLEVCLNVPVRLSGSGSVLFALFDDRQQAGNALNRIRSSYKELTCWLVKNNSW